MRSLIEYRAETAADEVFVVFDDLSGATTRATFREFDAAANRSAHLLLDLGLQPGDRINLHLGNCLEFLYLWFGAAKAGIVIMPTNTQASVEELQYLLDHSGSRLIFTQSEFESTAREARERCASVEDVLLCGTGDQGAEFRARLLAQPDTPPNEEPRSEDVVAIMYTSGTTSKPKGVLVTNANYIYAGETVAKAIRLSPRDRHLTVLPLFHGNAQYYSIMSALVTGASIALTARFSASRYFDLAIAHGCTVASLFAAPIRMILAQPRAQAHRGNALRVVIFAQNVTASQLEEWEERFEAPLLQLWGMTETMGPPLMNPIDFARDNMSIGFPVMGYEVALVDDEGKPVKQGQVGEIAVRGEPGWTLMKGYFNNPEATAKTIRNGWLMSGDNARQDEKGYFHFVDRAKDMIKRSGENIAASEVEAVILEHGAVFDCAVIGVPDPIRDETIVAVVVVREGRRLTDAEVVEWCRERLARFRVPGHVVFKQALPRTSVGKVQKHLLRREYRGLAERD
ncbi:MAG TPA: AMP-binding protein [Gammaproteobacteria bacterium]|nr:AMP-binding protein [Gammaproteobacteria bacterium]